MNIFVFDIETVPDVASGRRLHDLVDLTDKEVADAMFKMRREETGGSEFLRLHLQRIVTISAVLRSKDQIKVWSLGDVNASEKELIERFYAGIDKYRPTLISWNGGGFDLPVLHYRSLLHGISAPSYWETGDGDQSFRWNNYLSRYHYRHTDLMDVLSGYQSRACAPLDEIASMLGFPGKMGMSGALVWEYFQRGELMSIRNYCETDVLNTYLVYLRFELVRGKLTQQQYDQECARLREYLQSESKPHFNEFLQAWV
jgi:predicted PolB exonuclease-like 3'-5' exonuclease